MSEESSVVVVEQKEVDFYGDQLAAIRADDSQIYVAIRQMCQALGIDSQAQRRRMERHTILSHGLKVVANLATTFGIRDAYALRVDLVPLWLSGIRTSAVNEDVRPKLERFQREAAKVLWEAFQEGRLTADPTFDELLRRDTDAVEAYKLLEAITKLARGRVGCKRVLGGSLSS